MTPRAKRLLVVAAVAAAAGTVLILSRAFAPSSSAPKFASPPGPVFIRPASATVPPPTFRLSARQAALRASRVPQVRAANARYRDLTPLASILGPGVWLLDWVTHSKSEAAQVDDNEPVQTVVNGRTGAIMAVWSGVQAANPMARGHFGLHADNPWLWAGLAILFVAPFFDPRRPLRLLHLDLLVLLSFGVSQAFYTQGNLSASVPLVYPVLLYLLVRTLIAGLWPRRRPEALVPYAPTRLLACGLLGLVGLRIWFNLFNNKMIDVGYASVEGAFRVLHHLPLYVISQFHGDTYGPLNYIAYAPFEQLFPWTGQWTAEPAAHAAAIAFDLLTILGLYLVGTKLRAGHAGRRLGVTLAFAWAAYPYTLYALALNTNDALISALLVFALVGLASPVGRSAMIALAGAAKFAPLAVAPVLATGRGARRPRSIAISVAVTAAILTTSLIAYWPKGGFHVFWTDTIGFQMSRSDPFSIWGLHPALGWLATVVEVASVLFAFLLAFIPRRRDAFQVAGLGAAVLIATELPVKHWFYFYILWFAPYVLVTLFGQYRTERRLGGDGELDSATIVAPATPAGLEAQAA